MVVVVVVVVRVAVCSSESLALAVCRHYDVEAGVSVRVVLVLVIVDIPCRSVQVNIINKLFSTEKKRSKKKKHTWARDASRFEPPVPSLSSLSPALSLVPR